MDEYYEWIKELLKEEDIDLDAVKTTKNPDVLTHIHEAVRDLRDSLEIVRQDIAYIEQGIYSKAKVNKCALHGDQLVVSESSDGEKLNKNIVGSSSTSTQERPLNKLPKKVKERHVSAKTKCLLLGLPYYYPENDDETESPDSSDLEELKKKCRRLREQYQVLHLKKEQKSQKKRLPTKVTSGSQTTSDAYNTLDSCTDKSRIQYSDTDGYPSSIRGKPSADHRIRRESASSIRPPPKPTKYVSTPQLVSIDYSKRDSDGHISVPTLSEPESVIFVGDQQSKRSDSKDRVKKKSSKKVTEINETPDKKRTKKDRKIKKQKEPKPVKTETAIQTSPDTEQQRYARSRFLRSDRPKSARPERRLLRLNNYLCFRPESTPEPEQPTSDETLQVTKIVTDNIDEVTNSLGMFLILYFNSHL